MRGRREVDCPCYRFRGGPSSQALKLPSLLLAAWCLPCFLFSFTRELPWANESLHPDGSSDVRFSGLELLQTVPNAGTSLLSFADDMSRSQAEESIERAT
jgi:hypothetical protein